MTLPTLQALLLADQVYRDADTQKHIICGVFSQVFFFAPEIAKSPVTEKADEEKRVSINAIRRAGSPYAYVSITEVHGKRRFELRYVDLVDNSVLFKAGFEVQSPDPLKSIQLTIPLPTLPITHAGVFVLELLCENTLLGSHRVLATLAPNEDEGEL